MIIKRMVAILTLLIAGITSVTINGEETTSSADSNGSQVSSQPGHEIHQARVRELEQANEILILEIEHERLKNELQDIINPPAED